MALAQAFSAASAAPAVFRAAGLVVATVAAPIGQLNGEHR